MMKDEILFPLTEAYEKATGRRPSVSTCHRHRLNGINGVRLETFRLGGARLTSVEAVLRFAEAVTSAVDGRHTSPTSTRQRQSEIEKYDFEADELGL